MVWDQLLVRTLFREDRFKFGPIYRMVAPEKGETRVGVEQDKTVKPEVVEPGHREDQEQKGDP